MRRPGYVSDHKVRWAGPAVTILLVVLLVHSGAIAAFQGGKAKHSLTSLSPRVYFSPNPVEVGWGMTTNVDVVVENVEGLYAAEVRISFPAHLVQVQDSDPGFEGVQVLDGDIFAEFDTYIIQNTADNGTGFIEYIISVTGSEVGKDGSGILCTIPFQSLSMGSAVTSFVEVLLCERNGTTIQVESGDDQAAVDVVAKTSTPTLDLTTAAQTPSATPTTPGGETAIPTSTSTPSVLADVHVVPITQTVGLGDTCIVQIEVRDALDLYTFDVRVDYNGAILDTEDAEPSLLGVQVYMGDVFDSFSYHVLQNEVYDDGIFGQIHFVASVNGGFSPGFDGDGIMLWMILRGVSPGLSNITLSDVTLTNHAGTGIARTLFHGQVEVLSEGAPTPSATLTITQTPALTVTATSTLTSTLTATPDGTQTTPSPSASPTGILATPTPVCADRIENGSFEDIVDDEASPWVRTGSTTYSAVEQHTGTYCAWLGGYDDAADGLYQEVTIPSHPEPEQETTQAMFSYWWGMLTQETSHSFDFMQVRVRDTSGTLLRELETVSDGSTEGVWQESQFDLSDYEGQTIRVCFEAATNGSNVTNFYVDDVALIVCEILQPTPTATAALSPTISATPTETGWPTLTPTITPTPIVVVFQQSAGGYEDCYDSYLSSWDPTGNNGHQGALSIRTTGVKRPVIYFDVSSIPSGVTIMDARLELYASHYKSHTPDMTVDVYGLKRPWVEMETTWQEASSGVPWTLAGADDTSSDRDAAPSGSQLVSETKAWYDFDVTGLVQSWADGTRPNYGMLLLASGNTVEMSFWSSEYSIQHLHPRLVVKYVFGTIPTATNTPATTQTPGASPTPTASPTSAPAGTEMILQEGHLGYDGTRDTYIGQWATDTNHGGTVTMIVRQGDVRSALIRFDLSSIPAGATIEEATLGLYAVSRSNAGGLTVDLYRVSRSWTEGQATWNLARSSVAWGLPGCNEVGTDREADPEASRFVDSINDWHEWDITDLVQGWVLAPGTNRGVILKGDGTVSVEYSFAASEYWWAQTLAPKLVVRYST